MVHDMDHEAHVSQLFCFVNTCFSDKISSLFLLVYLFVIIIEVFLIDSDFYNWNRVKLRYCDGASFAGDAKFDNGVIILFHPIFCS